MSLLAEIHARRTRFHAEIARRAALVQPKPAAITYSIPNGAVGKPKLRPEPVRRLIPDVMVPQTMAEWYPFMWFWDLCDVRTDRPSTLKVQVTICARYGLTLADMLCSKRTAKVVEPRQIAMYLCKEYGRTLPEIGRRFGGRDHTTVLHAWRKITGRVERDPEFAATIDAIKGELR